MLGPVTNGIEVTAAMFRVEVNEWLRSIGVNPDLTENSDVHGAHELLPQDVEAVGWRGQYS